MSVTDTAGLSAEEKRRRLAELLAKKAAQPRTYPASFSQRRFWFLDQLEPGNPVHHIPTTDPLPAGEQDPALWQRAVDEVVKRHGTLRTVFRVAEGQPVQVVMPSVKVPLDFRDLSEMEPSARAAELRRLVAESGQRPFDLATGPLIRFTLVRVAPAEHVMLCCVHHIIADGWSMGILREELRAVHAAFSAGQPSPLPPLPIQFGDYAAWQNEQISGEALERQLEYWRGQLEGAPELLDIPTDRPRPAVQRYEGTLASFLVPSLTVDRLNALSREEGATLFMTLLAAFKIVLAEWSGSRRVVVGTPIAGRTRPEVEGLIGFFVNTLVLHTDLSGDPSFREAVRRVRATTLGAYAHQEMPFDKLVDDLGVERSLSHSPLFQVVFSLQSVLASTMNDAPAAGEAPPQQPSSAMMGAENETRLSTFDLTLNASEIPDGLFTSLEYRVDLWDRDTVMRLGYHFAYLITLGAENPDVPLSRLSFLVPEEQYQLLTQLNATAVDFPRDSSIATLFTEQAAATPDAAAVSTADGAALTYAELDARSNRLARHLRSGGVVRGTRVGLSVPRSAELIVALLAIVKAGAAYVPLDPSYPADRLTYMLGDAGVTHLVVHGAVPDALGGFAGETVRLADEAEAIAQQSADAMEDEATGEDLCYVIYTSGSTGRPKGVAVPHRGVSRLVKGGGFADFGAEQVFLQLAPIAFDASTFEVWGPLLNGARLVLFPPETPSLEELGRFVEAQGITTLWLTAGLFHQMVDGQLHHLRGVRQLLAGGDVLSAPHVRRAAAELPETRIINGYGPTESTTFTACHTVREGDGEQGAVPIGRPIGNTRVYVLNEHLRPVPLGAAGELYIAGDGLAHGYLNKPGITAERFVPDPFAAEPGGGRLYRSGDRVRWRTDGTLEFMGRLDDQVKIRGFRIELGEIEAALAGDPRVAECVVVAREDVPGDRRLVAYAVPAPGAPADGGDLRDALQGRLPTYMIPSVVVVLPELPLTANGKVDRRALPAPGGTAAVDRFTAPRTDTERVLASIWAECLAVEQVGVHDNFFELGGHSLVATRVVSRIREEMDTELPLRALFEAQSVAELAARIDADHRALMPSGPELVPVERTTPPPASFAQARLWFVERMIPGTPTYNVPTPLPLPGSIDATVLERTLGEIVRRHEALRTTFAAVDGQPVQVIHPAGGFRMEVVDLRSLADEARGPELGRLVGQESMRPFDLEAGPLFRATLYRITDAEALLLPVMHHVVSDGWSCDVLTRELNALYTAFAAGQPSPLPELPIQYADFAVWQRAWLTGDVLEEQLAFWKTQLAGAPLVLELPTDRPRPAVQTFRGRTLSAALPRELAERLNVLSRAEGGTLFMTLLAAFGALLGRWSGQSDLVIGSPIAGRTRRETEGLIGFFVNNLAMRADLSGRPTFRELLRRSREATLSAYAHQDLPFERLVEELGVERSASHSPVFQVLFNLLTQRGAGTPDAPPPAGYSESDEPAKHDLTLTVNDLGADVFASINFNTDLFDTATIRRMLDHFRLLLEQVAADPNVRVDEIDLLPAGERSLVVQQWNDTARLYPTDLRIHDLFEQQVDATPHAPALVFAGSVLTYAELNARANHLAHHLATLGAGPEVRVGVSMQRTPDLVVALLAVLKSGAAYVPVDPAYPADRIAYMLRDSGAAIVLTQSRVAAALPETAARIVAVDTDADAIAGQPDANPQAVSTPQNAAYAIYTSGSTGQPKGVVIEHRSTVTVLQWLRETVTDEERSSSLGSTSISFDVSIAEIFGTLCWGGKLVLVENALSLAELGEGAGIKLATMVPSAAQELLRMGGIPSTVRSMNLGGEPLPSALAQALYRTGTVEKVLNLYGPTEDTTYSTWSLVEKGGAKVYVGRPVANTQSYILDANLRPVPIGVPGELYLAGDGLSRGYLNRPGMTAERYIPNPFGPAGSRMYRVGDLTRYLADGTIEYLGRLDHQVKIRGFRIETGEIEAALGAHASVKAVVVTAPEDRNGDRRLAAYVVAEDGAAVDVAELRAHLASRLPDHMVPSAFTVMDALPLTPNGKVDRRALPAPHYGTDENAYAAPRTPTEETLAQIWRDVLGTDRISRYDGFFTLGGHSLLATRVVSRIRQALEVELPLRAVFEAPTLEALARRIDAERATGAGVEASMVRADRSQPLPLSFAQERLWFVDRLIPGSSAYNIPIVLPVPGADADVLQRTLAEIVRRHESLRTTFATAGEQTVQVIHPAGGFVLRVVHPATHDEAGRIIAEESNRPFDLQAGPLFRATLVHLPDDSTGADAGRDYPLPLVGEGGEPQASRVRAVLVMAMHHIVSDGWSVDVLTAELNAIYGAFAAGRPSPLPEPALQYADFAVWQRAWMTEAVVAKQVGYWKRQLAGAPAMLELPTDRPRPAVQSFRGAMLPVSIGREDSEALAALARREGATTFMVLLAAFQVLLARYSGQADVVVGSPIAGRNRAETEGLIGFFVNNLVLRADLGDDPSFRALLHRVKNATLGAYAHQDLPFERLVEELNVERSLAHTPLFQVMFALQNTATPATVGDAPADASAGTASADGAADADAPSSHTTAKFDLTLNLTETPHGLAGSLEYSTDLWDEATVRRMMRHFAALVHAAVGDAERPVSRLPLFAGGEESAVRALWAGPLMDRPADRTVHALFAEQARRTPDAVAVSFAGAALTYAEVDARANRLANRLRSMGIRADVPVAISVDRSPEMVVALLGVLKAGGAYLPVDPAYPADRRAYMLADSGAAVVLTQSHLAAGLPASNATVVRLDADWAEIERESADAPAGDATADSLAYVIYTSGSTGRPKGVMVPHRGVVNLALAQIESFRVTAESRVLQFASFSFDAAVSEVLTALLAGARLHLAPQDALMPGDPLAATLRGEEISVVTLPPSALAVMAESGFPRLETLVSAGEACPAEVARRWSAGRRFLNAYGPTEITVCATVAETEDGARTPSIGRPIANQRVYVLNGLDAAPVGVPGEICVAGAGVSRGYLGRAALTAEKFVPDPFAAEPGARMYRTGDLGRWLEDGSLAYLGRIDEQVKVRGFRIELGEIEAVLRAHPAVADVVAVAPADARGDRRLAAYVVARDGGSVDATALRAHLAAALPDYMVPAGIAVLHALPLTPNGKVDRRALPAVDSEIDADAFVEPRTETETALAGIFGDLLGRERVGASDDFFALGGHSLLATRLVSRVREALGVELPLRAVFEAPTVAALAVRVDAAAGVDAGPQAPPLVPVPRGDRVPLSFAQERLWFVERLTDAGGTYNIPLILPVPGADPDVVQRVLAEIVRRHEALRTTFTLVDGDPVQVIHPADAFRMDVLDLRGRPAADAERWIAEESMRRFDLERGPLFRATFVHLPEASDPAEDRSASPLPLAGEGGEPQASRVRAAPALLALVMHHVVSDGWSVSVLTRELGELYDAFAAGRPSPLPELPVQYADFAVWQRAWLTGSVLEREVEFWRGQLAGAPPVLELPTDRPRPPVQTYAGRTRTALLPLDLSQRLHAVAAGEGATLFMVMLAGFHVLLARYSGQSDVVVGSPIAGRNRAETEGLVGFFVNNLVLRGDVSGNPTFRELLGRVRETTLAAYGHQDLPFERLVEALGIDRSLSHTPLFQVLFNLLTAETGAGGGMPEGVDEWENDRDTAKYDLSLSAQETPQGIVASFNYNTDLFDGATIRRMLGHFRLLLQQVAADPGLRVDDVRLLADDEREQVLAEWNDTGRPYPTGLRIHDLFDAQVRATPAAPALAFGSAVLTYDELNGRANQLAHHLVSLGVAPEVRVAVAMERTPDLIVSLLAVLKAGGAYVPVDPAYPADRIAYMLEDSGAAVVLTQAHITPRLPATDARVVRVDADWLRIGKGGRDDVTSSATPQNAAYAIYTSGSTGRPKGVVIEHRSTVTVLQWLKETVTDEERSSSLGSTSISFDVSIAEIFGTLCWGGKLVLVENALSLAELGEGAGIKLATMVPSAAQELLRMGGIPSTVRSLNLGGEPLPNALAQALYRTGMVDKVLNLYGPTEDTTYSTWSRVEKGGAKVYVGRPVANTQSYILDANLRPVPIGVPGELYLAGDGLSRGYLNRPGMTAERYIPNPFGPAGSRMYRVGDLTRYLADGTIEYLGRLDHQVKIRGFRIEIGEVEAAVATHAAITGVAVVARESVDGDRRLVAYFVARPGEKLEPAELRAYLKQRLPEHMVPSVFMVLSALPLTPNGKVDRRALPAPEHYGDEAYVAPRDETETELAAIWAEILGVPRVGVHDDFFASGGHSLLAVRMMTRVKERWGREIPLAALFQGATVEHLASILRGQAEVATGSPLVPIQPTGSKPPLFMVHGAAGTVLRYVGLAKHLADRPVFGLRAVGLEAGETPPSTIEEMAAAYVAAIRQVQPVGPYHVAGWSTGCAAAFEVAQQLVAGGQEVALLALLDGKAPTPGAELDEPEEAGLLYWLAGELGGPLPEDDALDFNEALNDLEGEARYHRALEWINHAGPVLPADDTAPLRRYVDVLRASIHAAGNYGPNLYRGRMLLLQAHDRMVQEREMAEAYGLEITGDYLPGWRNLALGRVESRIVGGDHYAMFAEPHAATLAARLATALDGG